MRRIDKVVDVVYKFLASVTGEEPDPHWAFGTSLYLGYEFGVVRISDHDQPPGGGFSVSLGYQHGRSEISITVPEHGRILIRSQYSITEDISAKQEILAAGLLHALGRFKVEAETVFETRHGWKGLGE